MCTYFLLLSTSNWKNIAWTMEVLLDSLVLKLTKAKVSCTNHAIYSFLLPLKSPLQSKMLTKFRCVFVQILIFFFNVSYVDDKIQHKLEFVSPLFFVIKLFKIKYLKKHYVKVVLKQVIFLSLLLFLQSHLFLNFFFH